MAWNRIGQKAANVTKNTFMLMPMPNSSTAAGIRATDGIGRRNSITTRSAR